ncbi:MAG: IclR family transcriptional regulator C-terminal domain-containing protein [Nocardioidaceae bacterium]
MAPPSVLAVNWLAREVPLHATSTGKAFLAWLPPEEALGLLEAPLRGFTDTTVTDQERLLEELTETRARGYAQCAGELEPTLYGVSAPVLNAPDGRPMAVFSIWGPVNRRAGLAVLRAGAHRDSGGDRREGRHDRLKSATRVRLSRQAIELPPALDNRSRFEEPFHMMRRSLT